MKSSLPLSKKVARVAACLALLNLSVPGGALVTFGLPAKERVEASLAARAKAAQDLAARRAKSASRPLSAKEERAAQGRTGENPYLAGQAKWDVVVKGVDLMTGNYAMSATDLSFDGGYGIPVNVTRSYSANDGDEGPFGKGWTLSADVRSTAGGLLKSGSAPVRSVPVGFKERSSLEGDPNAEIATGAAAQPVEAVIATDAGGKEETVQKDVDGVLTTPPWDTNVNENTQYETVEQGGAVYQVMTHNETVTPEGTRYVYNKQGGFTGGGTVPWDQPSATPQPANVMKVASATDRQGNVTTYTYGTQSFTYAKSNGTTSEHPLTQVSMPGGHVITFTWGTSGAATGRIVSIADNSAARTVTYAYAGTAGHGLLDGVTTPGGKTTTYGYGAPYGSGSSDFLTTVTDPRGLTTSIVYRNDTVNPYGLDGYSSSYGTASTPVVAVDRILWPNGTKTFFTANASGALTGNAVDDGGGVTGWTTVTAYNDKHLPSYVDTDTSGHFVEGFSAIPTQDSTTRTNVLVKMQLYSPNLTVSFGYGQWTDVQTFELASQNQIETRHFTYQYWHRPIRYIGYAQGETGSLAVHRGLAYGDGYNLPSTFTQTDTTYNFLGQPLSKTMSEGTATGINYGLTTTRAAHADYAYWGPDKYFQQKAVRTGESSANYRYSYTDYYDNAASAGSKGQTYRVYDPKYGGIGLTSATPPAYATTANAWRYQVAPTVAQFSAQFAYDGKGRPTDVWKLQSAATSPWSYVQTHTTYGADGGGAGGTWGQASSVVEDYGGVNRTTTTNAYTAWGKACDVVDAKGQRFTTDFDPDGQVNSVTLVGAGPVVTYGYGGSPGTVAYGQPTSVVDGLSGVQQTITYAASGGGIGMPASVSETSAWDTYSASYAYGPMGDRASATYTTAQGTTRWGYGDYEPVGGATSPSRAFQTLWRLDSSGQKTSEELQYAYDTDGKLVGAAFAQTPQAASALANGGFYDVDDATHLASRRARAAYAYDAGGRLTSLGHYWDTLGSNGYASEALLGNSCVYELGTGRNRGLKTSSTFWSQDPSNHASFVQDRSESYGYDPDLDYLTSASYGDGLPSASPTWSYDAAGNRSDSVCDNLNRATSVGGVSCTNDVLGNRITKGGTTSYWDPLNRLAGQTGAGSAGQNQSFYDYRADGLRVHRGYIVNGNYGNGTNVRYRYDGQMGMEDREDASWGNATTRYGLGARGVDLIEKTPDNGSPLVGFPIYDAHGNNVATLTRSGTSYAVNDRRSYDAWGQVRAQQSGGDPTLRYCANLGHKQDDESGMVYMRARYYEPSSGRFVSEDPGRNDGNWFTYAKQNPVSGVDASGKFTFFDLLISFTEEAKIRGAQLQALLATMHQATGAAVASIMTGQFREAIQIFECNVEGVDDVTGARVLEGFARIEEDPEVWNKVYLCFRGRGELTGDEYEAFVHLFSDGTRIFDAEYHASN